jgi:hypothetical protein
MLRLALWHGGDGDTDMAMVTADSTMNEISMKSTAAAACDCNVDVDGNAYFFRGILFGVPAGLLLWFGALKLAGELFRHL